MKLANHRGRAVLVFDDSIADVHDASRGRFGPDPMSVFVNWPAFVEFAGGLTTGTAPLDEKELDCPVPAPRQVFAIGLNYRSHAEESGMAVPSVPATFTKFPASLSGPFSDIEIVGDTVDWEVELVAVIASRADRIHESEAWSYVAGLTVGQDISDRTLQFAAGSQFSLGKSRRGFGPMGPWMVTLDEVPDPDNLALGCAVDGETVQDAHTAELIFSVPRLIAELSAVLSLLPGDVLFTGTPAGIGATRKPPRFLRPGQVLESWIEGIGTIRNRCVVEPKSSPFTTKPMADQ
jgi:2,4-didehydro-3-deoxy-L-rhamnonate hydrolase